MAHPPAKPRSRDQIVKSLLKPQKAQASPTQAGAALQRRLRTTGVSARERVGDNAARVYRRNLRASAQPLPAGILSALAVGGGLAVVGIDLYVIAVAIPLVCVVAYGAANGMIGSVARRNAKDELDLAGAFDRLVESAARDLPDATLDRLVRIKGLLVRLLAELSELREHGVVSMDDAYFVRQVVARYAPDALAPYLAMPAARRSDPASPTESAERLLNEQLDMIEEKLSALVQKADQAQLDRMRRNRSFLERKLR